MQKTMTKAKDKLEKSLASTVKIEQYLCQYCDGNVEYRKMKDGFNSWFCIRCNKFVPIRSVLVKQGAEC